MTTLLIVVHVIVCLFLICIVLLQHGKGADIGASFGSSSQSVFGAEGPVPLLNKITTLVAIVFMGTSVALAYASASKSSGSVMSDVKVEEQKVSTQQAAPSATPTPQAATKEKPKTTGQPTKE
jgi:preprotein translocase subunit SecG